MNKILNNILRVEKDESAALLWISLFGLFLGLNLAFFDLVALVNFLDTYNASYLPGAFICSGLLGIFVCNTFISIQNWIAFSKASLLAVGIIILFLLGIFLGSTFYSAQAFTYTAFVFSGPLSALALLVFWGLFDRLFNLSQSKRVAAVAPLGMSLAIVTGLSFIAFNHLLFNTSLVTKLYFFALVASLFCFFVLFLIGRKYAFLRKVTGNILHIKASNNYKKFLKDSYSFQLFSFSLLASISFFLVDFAFLWFVGLNYSSPTQLIVFLTGFFAVLAAASFLIKYLLLNWINEKYGYLVTFLVAPVLLSLFTAIYGGIGYWEGYSIQEPVYFFIFMLVCIVKGIAQILYFSFEFPTFKFFFMPLNQVLRADFQSKIERVVREGGKVLAGIFAAVFTYYFSFTYFPVLLIVFFALWIFSSIKLNRSYREKLKFTLSNREEKTFEKKERVDFGVVGKLGGEIQLAKSDSIETLMALLKILDPLSYKECILQLLQSENDTVQNAALFETGAFSILPAIPILEKIQRSKFYPVLKNRELIEKIYAQLKAAEFRLKKEKYVEQLTFSKLHQERLFGALLAAYVEDSLKPKLLNKLFRDEHKKVRYMAIASAALSENSDIQKNMIDKLADSMYSNVATAAITATGTKMYSALDNAFYRTGQLEKVQLRIIQVLGRGGSEEAINLLLKKLSYKNQNVSKAAFEAISNAGFNIKGERAIVLKAELEEFVSVLVWNMSVFLDLERQSASETLLLALKAELAGNYKYIFKLLSVLYEPQTIQLVEANIFSSDPEKSEYSIELLEVIIADEIKAFLLPVLNSNTYKEKIAKMQAYFPTEPLSKIEILYDLIQRDYKYVNRWTKACALKELSDEKEEINPDIFLANIINPDPLLKETATVALYKKAPELFYTSLDRFKKEFDTEDTTRVKEKLIIETEKDPFLAPSLQYEMIKFLNGIKEFEQIPGIVLMEVAKITDLRSYDEGYTVEAGAPEELDYFIIRSGRLQLNVDGKPASVFEAGSFVNTWQYLVSYLSKISLVAETDALVYRVKKNEFDELMSFYEEIPLSILHAIDNRFEGKEEINKNYL